MYKDTDVIVFAGVVTTYSVVKDLIDSDDDVRKASAKEVTSYYNKRFY